MATTAVRPPASPVQKRMKWNTLQMLRGSLYISWGLCVVYLIAVIGAAGIHRDAMTKVCKDSAPSVIAAEHIKFALSDMDANAANELLFPHGDLPEALEQYEDRREEAVEALIEAAENITYGDKEREPIKNLALFMGNYQSEVQRARDLHERHDPEYVAAYLKAAKILDEKLLPNADALHKANEEEMNKAYAGHEGESMASMAFVVLIGLGLGAFLICMQLFLLRKTRRILNPMLLLATVLTLGLLLHTVHVMSTEREQLRVAKKDAFDSIVALWQTRAVSYAARADQSRYLLEPAKHETREADFYTKARLLATMPNQVTQMQDVAVGQWFEGKYVAFNSGKNRVDGFSGYLADELGNITFPGEREAALKTLSSFIVFIQMDREIRQKEMAGDHDGAIALCLGTNPDKPNANEAFAEFDKYLDKTLEINQKAFDQAVDRGFEDLKGFDLRASIVIGLIALLVFGGLFARIGEYR